MRLRQKVRNTNTKADTYSMTFIEIWDDQNWTDHEALNVAIESLRRHGREIPLVEWLEPAAPNSDLLATAEHLNLTDRELVGLVIAYAHESGFTKQLDAHARRTLRRTTHRTEHQNDNDDL